ncbi:MAG: TetR/AcrR family transcriptional regulator [Nocardioidaceae bacterium]
MTRRAVLVAARSTFAEHGYRGTTVKVLARAAGVSVQTIYDTYGSKAKVLMAMVDVLDEEAGVVPLYMALRETTDPRDSLALFARIRRQIRERSGDLVQMMRAGARDEPEVAAAWAEGMRRRHTGLTHVMTGIEATGALRPGLDAERAADVAAALVTDDVCDVLVDQRGWDFDAYETWLADALADLLLR